VCNNNNVMKILIMKYDNINEILMCVCEIIMILMNNVLIIIINNEYNINILLIMKICVCNNIMY